MLRKKILALLAAAALALTLTACGGSSASIPKLTLETTTDEAGEETVVREKPEGDYAEESPDGMIGLLTYMEDGGAIVRDTENVKFEDGAIAAQEDVTSFVQMSYKEIGAVNGYRYQFTYNGSTVQAEFYRFDPDNLDVKGKECLGSVKEKGFFTVLGSDVPATLHPSGEYLMIYTDANAEKNEKNAAQKEWAEELFVGFKA